MVKKNIILVLLFFSFIGVFSQCSNSKSANDFKKKSAKLAKGTLKEKSAYQHISKYYEYACECKNGTNREKELISLISRIVDVNKDFYKEKYGVLDKVYKCKSSKKKTDVSK